MVKTMIKKAAKHILIAILLLAVLTGCSGLTGTKVEPAVLEPTDEEISAEVLWRFLSFCKIPHLSGNEAEISRYFEFELKKMGFICIRDAHNNVIVEIPATVGFEAAPLTIIQGHMDMVAIENGIGGEGIVSGSAVNVIMGNGAIQSDKKTVLGADCGLANAAIFYLIGQPEYVHGPLRIIFTSGGEMNMTGARSVDDIYVKNAKYFVNVDGIQLQDIIGGNAAGRREVYQLPLTTEPVAKDRAIKIEIKGFAGGHYGSDIWRERANAIKLMADILSRAEQKIDFQLAEWKGGLIVDSIPGECEATIILNQYDSPAFEKIIYDVMYETQERYKATDPNGTFAYSVATLPQTAISADCKRRTIGLINELFDGVYSRSESDPNDIITSANVERILITGDSIRIVECIKSDSASHMQILTTNNARANQSAGFDMQVEEVLPWEFDLENNQLLAIMTNAYKRKNGHDARVMSGHADLETPIFLAKNPAMHAVTIGLDIVGAHTTNEYAKTSSIGPFVKTLAFALRTIAYEIEAEEEEEE